MIPEKSAIRPQVTALRVLVIPYTAEINGQNVECGVRSSAYYATHTSYKRIGSQFFHRIDHQSVGTATAK